MKRLLIAPLLIALTGCSNDLSVKTDVGEVFYVVNSAVKTVAFTKSDLIKKYEATLETKKYNWEEPYFDNRNSWANCVDRGDMSIDSCTRIWKPHEAELKYNSQGDQLKLEIETFEALKKDSLNDIQLISITFRPIFIDLNNKKTALNYIEIACFNPDLKDSTKSAWKSILGVEEANRYSTIAKES